MRNGCRPKGRFFYLLAILLMWSLAVQAQSPTTTRVSDVVYRADGSVASGTVLISWPAFTTADGATVTAGSLSVKLGNGGSFIANLAPNTGAQPSGAYYKVTYQLTGLRVAAVRRFVTGEVLATVGVGACGLSVVRQ